MDPYDFAITVGGVAALIAALAPPLLKSRPLSAPMLYFAVGAIAFGPITGVLGVPHPLDAPAVVERLTELAVIVALMGAGLKIDRVVGVRRWASTWRLLAITMPLTIIGAAVLGHWLIGLAPAAAVLLGAVIAPTDPVLASDVQVGGPGDRDEPEVRFALTSEAGLNDGLAFPFTNAAIAMAVAGTAPAAWLGRWLAVDVAYKIAMGLVAGVVVGRLLAFIVFGVTGSRPVDRTDGFVALGGTLLAYGLTELAGGYGFLAVFVAACTLRSRERDHRYHRYLHTFSEQVEMILTVGLLVLLGGAVAGGLLRPLRTVDIVAVVVILALVRPAAGLVALLGSRVTGAERVGIATFGIRGIGSLYYLAHALNRASFDDAERMWAVVGAIVVVSVVVHGITAGPAMAWIERRSGKGEGVGSP